MKLSLTKNLDKLRADAISQVNAHFEALRPVVPAGQAAMYQRKYEQACLVNAHDTRGKVDRYPLIVNEAKVRGTTHGEMANIIIAARDKENAELEKLELRRVAVNLAIKEATKPKEIEHILVQEGIRSAKLQGEDT